MEQGKLPARQGLIRMASETFDLSGDVHRLVTFLNQSLKNEGIIFGLSKAGEKFSIAIYRTDEARSLHQS